MLTKQVVLAFILHLAAEAKVEQPTQLLDWSTGWGGLDPGEQGKVEKMVQDAKDREEVARKELMEARADEQKAQDMAQSKHAKGGESQPSTVYPVHSKLVHAPIPTMEEVTAAKHRADEEEKRAAAAQQTAKKHLQKVEAAAKEASQSSDDRQREKAQKEAKSEAALATEAEHNATVKRLEAKIAHDKVRFMEIQSLRGGWQTESPSQWVEYASVGAGIFALALCAFLVPGRSKTAKQEPLKEPLLTEEPDWARESGDDEHSAEEWKQRAMAALERSRKSQEEMAGVKADAEVTKAQHAEQVAALEAKLKAEAGTTQSALNQKVTALEQKVEESQMALQAKSDEAAAAKQSLEDFKSQMAQADSHSAGMVDALREREEKLAAAHAETALLTERLQLAQENLDRTKKECLSAQAAAEEAQNMYQHALSKVDLNAEEEKARADLKQKSLSAAEQELEQAKQEVSNLSEQMENSGHKFEMERQKSVGLNEALAVTQSQVKDLLAKVSSVTSASEVLQQEKATAEEKIAALEKEKALQLQSLEEEKATQGKLSLKLSDLQQELEKCKANHADDVQQHAKKIQEADSVLEDHKTRLEQAKQAGTDALQALDAVRQQAAAEITEHKKVSDEHKQALEDLQDEMKKHSSNIAHKELEAENEKNRADLAESIAASRQEELETAQKLAEKAKATLQSVRSELTAECSAAKAQVEVERKLALEAEESAEKFRLEAQAARASEQKARIAEQEARALIAKLRQSAAVEVDDGALTEMRKQLASAQGEAEKAKKDLDALREAKASQIMNSESPTSLEKANA